MVLLKNLAISSILVLIGSLSLKAQLLISDVLVPIDEGEATISGPSLAYVNDYKTYNLYAPGFIHSTNWSVSGGVVTSSSKTSATVRWTTTGSRSVSASVSTSGGYYFPVKLVSVSRAPVVAPPTPSAPYVYQSNCGSSKLRRHSPPSGVRWYWQLSSNGKSTSYGYGIEYTTTSSRRIYLRARNNSTGAWSNGLSSVYVFIKERPPTPPSLIVSTNACGPKTVTAPSLPPGTMYYWQTSSTGTSTSDLAKSDFSNNPKTLYSTGNVYLKARKNGCWSSSARSLYVIVDNGPTVLVST